jgi:hypothetical protein
MDGTTRPLAGGCLRDKRAPVEAAIETEKQVIAPFCEWKHNGRPQGIVMSGCRPLIKGFFRRCAGRGCGHVFGLVRGEFDPLALMLSADPLPRSRQRA